MRLIPGAASAGGVKIDSLDWYCIGDIGIGIAMNPAFIRLADSEVSASQIQTNVLAIANYLRQLYTGPERITLKTGMTIIVSQSEIPDATKVFVWHTKFYNWRTMNPTFVLPVLVDLQQNTITTLKRPGFLGFFPISKNLKFVREKLTLEGRLVVT